MRFSSSIECHEGNHDRCSGWAQVEDYIKISRYKAVRKQSKPGDCLCGCHANG